MPAVEPQPGDPPGQVGNPASHPAGGASPAGSLDAESELARLGALPLPERAKALAGVVQRLEDELDETEQLATRRS